MFSTTFRYALISLMELSRSQGLRQASTIASQFNLSQHYLSVVIREVNLLTLHRSLAGSSQDGEAELDSRLGAGEAEIWLQQVAQRWSQELAATTLADLQSLESSHEA